LCWYAFDRYILWKRKNRRAVALSKVVLSTWLQMMSLSLDTSHTQP
jgi:hypothetical protein